jgi:hypothetical protein
VSKEDEEELWEPAEAFESEVWRDIWALRKQSSEAKRRSDQLIDYLNWRRRNKGGDNG